MKRGNYLNYEFFEQIDNNSELAVFFNKIFKDLHLVRMISALQIFNEDEKIRRETGKKHKKRVANNAMRFYETCLFEVYTHALIRKLNYWIETIQEYLDEYNGSWEYYARSKRLDLISKYGGEDYDYDEDGSIKTDIELKELINYCIIGDIIQDDWKDIVLQTHANDLDYIYRAISVNGNFSIRDMFKAMGNDTLKSYRSENGVMIENSESDEVLHRIQEQDRSLTNSSLLYVIVKIINSIIEEIKELKKDDDNKKYFRHLSMRLHKT